MATLGPSNLIGSSFVQVMRAIFDLHSCLNLAVIAGSSSELPAFEHLMKKIWVYLSSHRPIHHLMCLDLGERSRALGPSCFQMFSPWSLDVNVVWV